MAVKSAFRLSTEKQSKEYVPLKGESRTGTSSPLSSSSSPLRAQSLIWQNLPAELRVEALRRAHLVQLLKQVNPELQLCRRSVTDVTSVRAKTTSDKGTQVPDIRFEFAGTRKGKPRAFVGLGVRIQPKQRPSSNNNNNNNNNNSNNNNSSVNTSYNNSNSNNNSYRSNSSYCGVRQPPPFPGGQFFTQRHPWIPPPPPRSFLRADAAPHIPRSILRNNARRNPEPSQVSSRRRVINMTSSEQTSLVDKEANKNVEKVASVEAKDPGGGDDKSIDVKCAEAPAEKINDASVGGAGGGVSSGDDDSVVVVLNEPRREQDLERKYGQFFCRRCLRGWSSRNLWCVRSTCKVYIKQTCNTCNKVVRPYLVCNLPLEEQNKKDYQPQQRHLAAA